MKARPVIRNGSNTRAASDPDSRAPPRGNRTFKNRMPRTDTETKRPASRGNPQLIAAFVPFSHFRPQSFIASSTGRNASPFGVS